MAEVADAFAAGPAGVIPATKLHIPAVRPGLVLRDALVAALARGRARKLTLLDAPAGFGKTTLLAEWYASPAEGRPFSWVTLDEGDNDPVRFWTAVIDALRTVAPGFGKRAWAALQARNVGLLDVTLPLLVNELMGLPQETVLVLDDYHLVGDERVHSSVAYLLDRLPPNVQLAIASRFDPPLPLGRLRARGEMTEVRAAELRLSNDEAAGLLRAALGLELEPADIARLQERTEGWAAGLYLAALSLRGHDNPRSFIASFAGDDRQIVDYLSAEVLTGQPAELRDFLLRTSVLQRLCGSLCDAVTGGEDSASTLERIEELNLFLVPLDNSREWYRYHHLFGELLRHELDRSDPESIPTLHRRAYGWYASSGMTPEAVPHAAAAGDFDEARELVAANWNEYFNQGQLETVAAWLRKIPREEVSVDARLCVAQAWLALDFGRLDQAERWVATAEGAIRAGGDGSQESEAAVVRAVHGFKAGDLGAAADAARRVLELQPEEGSFPDFVARCLLGVTHYWRGEAAEAQETVAEAAGRARAAGNDLGQGYALGYLALLHAEHGELDEAERLARRATGLSDDPGFVEHFTTMLGHLARGTIEERRGRLEQAEQSMARALELARRGAGRLELASAALSLARVRQTRGDHQSAKGLLTEARQLVEECVDPGTLSGRLEPAEHGVRAAARERSEVEELTDRELAVLRMLGSRLSRREIGEALYVSLDTVKTHLRGIYRKLGASSREEALERARSLGLL